MADFDMDDLGRRMGGALDALMQEFSGLRTGRASSNLLENIQVEAYGSMMPLNQVANVNVPEPRLLTVNVWDSGVAKSVERAISNAGLGLNPIAEGAMIRVPIPELSEERRLELVKIASKFAEQARVSVRNVRRDGMEEIKQMEKDSDISEDDHKRLADQIQKLTDEYVGKIDAAFADKEKDIMQV